MVGLCALMWLWLCIHSSATFIQNFYWRDYSHGVIPQDALQAFLGIYIGQVHKPTGLITAALYPYRNDAIIMYGPREDIKEHIKILCTPVPQKFYWEEVDFSKVNMTIMKDAVIGGFQEKWLTYIGLVHHLDSWKIGKVFDVEVTSWEGVYVWANDGERIGESAIVVMTMKSPRLRRSCSAGLAVFHPIFGCWFVNYVESSYGASCQTIRNRSQYCEDLSLFVTISYVPATAVLMYTACVTTVVLGARDFYWRDYVDGVVPHDAFEGKTGIYVGQVYYSGRGLLPATIYPYRNTAVAVYGTRQNVKEDIKILCSPDTSKFYWETVDFAKGDISQMRNAARGGFEDNQSLYVGLINHEGDWKIGKVIDFDRNDIKGLYIWDKTGNYYMVDTMFLFRFLCAASFLTMANLMQNFEWKSYSHDVIPEDALEVFPGIYVGNVYVKTGILPAAIHPYRSDAIIVYGKRLDIKGRVQILCTTEPEKFYWEPVDFEEGTDLKDALVGGYQEGSLLYIGLVKHLDIWKVGKVFDIGHNEWKGMYVWDNEGNRVILQKFEILKYDRRGRNDSRIRRCSRHCQIANKNGENE
ncbi:hypothetical protein Trydic_g1646 [Trypoxylus dichotomus]